MAFLERRKHAVHPCSRARRALPTCYYYFIFSGERESVVGRRNSVVIDVGARRHRPSAYVTLGIVAAAATASGARSAPQIVALALHGPCLPIFFHTVWFCCAVRLGNARPRRRRALLLRCALFDDAVQGVARPAVSLFATSRDVLRGL